MNLVTLVEKALPSLANSTYNKEKNIYLTDGYTSRAGNTYFQGIRLSDRIIIKENIGQGYAYTFLNEIQIFGFDGNMPQLLTSRSYNCKIYDESFVKSECTDLINEYLKNQCLLSGGITSSRELQSITNLLVNEAYTQMKQLQS